MSRVYLLSPNRLLLYPTLSDGLALGQFRTDRHTLTRMPNIPAEDLELLATSPELGGFLVAGTGGEMVYQTYRGDFDSERLSPLVPNHAHLHAWASDDLLAFVRAFTDPDSELVRVDADGRTETIARAGPPRVTPDRSYLAFRGAVGLDVYRSATGDLLDVDDDVVDRMFRWVGGDHTRLVYQKEVDGVRVLFAWDPETEIRTRLGETPSRWSAEPHETNLVEHRRLHGSPVVYFTDRSESSAKMHIWDPASDETVLRENVRPSSLRISPGRDVFVYRVDSPDGASLHAFDVGTWSSEKIALDVPATVHFTAGDIHAVEDHTNDALNLFFVGERSPDKITGELLDDAVWHSPAGETWAWVTDTTPRHLEVAILPEGRVFEAGTSPSYALEEPDAGCSIRFSEDGSDLYWLNAADPPNNDTARLNWWSRTYKENRVLAEDVYGQHFCNFVITTADNTGVYFRDGFDGTTHAISHHDGFETTTFARLDRTPIFLSPNGRDILFRRNGSLKAWRPGESESVPVHDTVPNQIDGIARAEEAPLVLKESYFGCTPADECAQSGLLVWAHEDGRYAAIDAEIHRLVALHSGWAFYTREHGASWEVMAATWVWER